MNDLYNYLYFYSTLGMMTSANVELATRKVRDRLAITLNILIEASKTVLADSSMTRC